MKTNNLNLLFFLSLLLLTFVGCRKDSITTEIIEIPNEPEIKIESTINGFITDRNGTSISGAEISILNASTQTNEFGFFEITGLVDEKFAVIKVEKLGFFNQYKTIIPSKTATNQTRIQLTAKDAPETIASSNGGEVPIGQNSSVLFQPNSFIDEQGNAYNGNITIYSFYIDPTHIDINQFMPGNLMARNTNNEIRVLESYGMVNVILEGEGGQKLNINKSAILTTAVPSSILNSAPAEIPLWYFDEEEGLWIEEGKAVLQNGKYIGDVEHFTFWNCDVPSSVTYVKGSVINNSGNTPFSKVQITNIATGDLRSTWTDSEGNFQGAVPQGVTFLLEFYDHCGLNVITSGTIGPFSEEQVDLGEFDISNYTDWVTLTGVLVDCNQEPISNGQVILNNGNQFGLLSTSTNNQGEFSFLSSTCGFSELELTGIDLDNIVIGNPFSISLNNNSINIGFLEACNPNFAESVILTYDGNTQVIPNCQVNIISDNDADVYSFVYEYVDTGVLLKGISSFYDYNKNLLDPDWDYASGGVNPQQGSNFTYLEYLNGIFGGNITVVKEATNPGDLMTLKIENCTINIAQHDNVTNTITQTNYPNSTVIFTGVQQ